MDVSELKRRLRNFDTTEAGVVKAYDLVKVLQHAFGCFTDDVLLGLQFQLENLNGDGTVDYEGFLQLFAEDEAEKAHKPGVGMVTGSLANQQDYETLLSNINAHVQDEGLDLERIFDIF